MVLALEKLAAGETIEELLDAHPRAWAGEALQAAVEFEARSLIGESVLRWLEPC